MGSFSAIHWIVVILVVVLLFGGTRISSLMGDVASGIKSFKKGMREDEEEPPKLADRAAKEEAKPASSSTISE